MKPIWTSGSLATRHTARRAAVAFLLALGISVPAVLSGAQAYAVPSFHQQLDPSQVRMSLSYLMTTYHVSEAEALRRLELQNDGETLGKLLERDRPTAYATVAMDQENGGNLIVYLTNPSVASPYLNSMSDRGHIQVRGATHSLKELTAAQSRIDAKIGTGHDATYLTSIDAINGHVILAERRWVAESKRLAAPAATTASSGRVVDGDTQVAEEAATADSAAKAEGDLVAREIIQPPVEQKQCGSGNYPNTCMEPYVDWGFCHPLYCSTTYGAMRGGLRLNIQRDGPQTPPNWGGCTAGYNVRSRGGSYNGWAWVVTAGHCFLRDAKQNTTPINHNGYDILQRDRSLEFNTYPYDYALMNYTGNNSVTWLENWSGRNGILKYCRNGGEDSDANTPCGPQTTSQNEYITGIHTLTEAVNHPGWVVCASGSGSNPKNYSQSWDSGAGEDYLVGTRCGVIVNTVNSDGLSIDTDICARDGDSGGPLFSELDHTGYGILEGSLQSRSGVCTSGEENNYIALSTIFNDVNQPGRLNGGSTFGPILSSFG